MNAWIYLIRRIVRHPGTFAMMYATIALAVGVNLGAFSMFQALLLKGPGIPDAGNVLRYSLQGRDGELFLSGPIYQALLGNASMSNLSAWKMTEVRLRTQSESIRVKGYEVTANGFSVFELKPALGRFFDNSDDSPGGGKDGWTAVLGYTFWKAQFAGDPNVVGQVIFVEGAPVRIIGVLPREFSGLSPLFPASILLPRHFLEVSDKKDDFAQPGLYLWQVFGRLQSGESIRSIQANLRSIEPSVKRQGDPTGRYLTSALFDGVPFGSLISVSSVRFGTSFLSKELSRAIIGIESLAVAILIFCGCNLAMLIMARAKREEQASAVRVALGCPSIQQVRFAMIETVVATSVGCLLAMPLAWGIERILSRVIQSISGLEDFLPISPDPIQALTASIITLAIAALIVLGVCIRQREQNIGSILRQGKSAVAPSVSQWVIGFEVFAAIILFCAACLNSTALQYISNLPTGFEDRNMALAYLDLNANRVDAADGSSLGTRIMERIENSPGIESVATMSVSPLSGAITSSQVATRDKGGAMETREIWPEHVSANYFPTIGTRIIQGRGFNDGDLTDNPVCVISVGAAAMLFSRQAALGQLVYQGRGKEAGVGSSSSVYCQVIGVAQDAHFKSMSAPADAVVYTLIKGVMPNLVVRAATTGLAIQAIQGAAQAVDLAALAGPIETIHARVGDDLRLFRVVTLAGEFCAGIAAIILGVGVFGILALQVAERRREIGVLMALGAGRRDVCWWVARKMRRSATIGLILGSVTALLAVKQFSGLFHQNWLYQVVVYLGALLLLGLLLLTAAFVPLRRALAVSPMECLSCE